MVRTIYQQLSPAEVHGQLDRVVEQLREPFAQVAELLADAAPDILAFTAFPVAHWQKLWSNNPQERLNREIRRRRACPRKGTWWAFSPTGYRRGAWWARCWPSNTTNGPNPPLPHHPQRRRQRGTAGAQYAGRSGLINIKRDDALLHYLTGHYRGEATRRRVIDTTCPNKAPDGHTLFHTYAPCPRSQIETWRQEAPTPHRGVLGPNTLRSQLDAPRRRNRGPH